QGDERRDDDRRARQEHRRQLIAQRLARAGRQDGKRILAIQHAPDDFFLARLEALVAEVPSKRFGKVDVDRHDVLDQTFLAIRTARRQRSAARFLTAPSPGAAPERRSPETYPVLCSVKPTVPSGFFLQMPEPGPPIRATFVAPATRAGPPRAAEGGSRKRGRGHPVLRTRARSVP